MNFHELSYSDNLSLYALSSKKNKLSKVLIGVVGEWHGHVAGSFTMDIKTMQNMKDNFDKGLIDVVCDYEHQTLTGEIAPASGWIKSVSIEDNKLYAHVKWNKQAIDHIKSKQYRYVSPVYAPNTTDQRSGKNIGWTLHSLSLTNKPFLEELGEVLANTNKSYISLKVDNNKLTEEVKSLKEQLDKFKEDKALYIVNKAIKEYKLKPAQKEYALKLANDDIEAFESFISNSVVNPLFAMNNTLTGVSSKSSQTTDIDDMVNTASNVN